MTPVFTPARDVPLGTVGRPAWRGRLHALSLVAVVPVFGVLLALATTGRARLAVAIYAVGLCSMFVASATYHRWVHTVAARKTWQRVDHAMIFAAIAGSATPVCLLGLPNRFGISLLVFMWVGCVSGIAMKIAGWKHQRIAGGIMYIAVSWVGIVAVPDLWRRFGAVPPMLMILSGVFYTVGAIGFYRKWPRLRPAVFSFHEVWHAHTVIAAGLHLVAVWLMVA
jgi:hemolysin III